MKKITEIPTHQFYDRLERSIAFQFNLLKEKNAYDPQHYHRHSYYEIFFFLKGGGIHEIDFQSFPVKANSLHFVAPGQVHLLRRAADSNGFVILFSRDFYHLGAHATDVLYELPFLTTHRPHPTVSIPEEHLPLFHDIFKHVQQEYSSATDDKQEIIHAWLNIILIHAKRLFKPTVLTPASGTSNDLSNKFQTEVEKHFLHLHSVSDYAERLFVSPSHLNDVIHDNLGVSAGQFIHERLILEAKRLLFHSSAGIGEIASMLNFEDSSYFTRFFKKHVQMTPGDFRVFIREKYH